MKFIHMHALVSTVNKFQGCMCRRSQRLHGFTHYREINVIYRTMHADLLQTYKPSRSLRSSTTNLLVTPVDRG